MLACRVSVLNTKRDFFDYQQPLEYIAIGTRVLVPFGKQTRLGVIIGYEAPLKLDLQLKQLIEIIDPDPILSPEILKLCQWISSYYQAPLSDVIALALPKKYRQGKKCNLPTTLYYKLSQEILADLVPKQAKMQQLLLDFLAKQTDFISIHNIQQAGFKKSTLQILCEKNILEIREEMLLPKIQYNYISTPLSLNTEQQHAVNHILQALHTYRCFVLYGVTGSGKTEVYLQVIAPLLEQKRQILILVPEIGLTPQLLDRFRARFQIPILTMHSHLNDTERQIAWQFAADNHVQLIIGTRSAIFTPMPNLGLIIIDEEHDSSFKQMESVRYSARDTALMRAYHVNIPIILGSATPSLETLHNINLNKYYLLRLTNKALNNNPLHFHVVDLRNQTLNNGVATQSLDLIQQQLTAGNQVLLFINRRGFAPVLLCHQCSWIADCDACDSHLTFHRKINRLICHHCGATHLKPHQCQRCHSMELLPVGIGTQRVYEYLSEQFPNINIARIDRDEMNKKHALDAQLTRIQNGEVQLIIGTQMLAKGHHFPNLSLVVVLDVDQGFYNQDFRSLEHLGQLLTQVAGRTGRESLLGQVVIQTHLPDHPLLQILIQQGYNKFATALLEQRQAANLPPYNFMAILRAQSNSKHSVIEFTNAIKKQLQKSEIQIFGPAPAPLARKENEHRMQLLLKSASRNYLHKVLTSLRQNLKVPHNIRWSIDVDPVDLS